MGAVERQTVAQLLRTAEPTDAQIMEVIASVGEAGGFDYARQRALSLAERADGELDRLPPSTAREALRASIVYVVDRRR
jgi:geranylgeranyl pyrophosphate synthase